MQDLDLSGRELGVLRALMAMEPSPGSRCPEPAVLERIHALVPCDQLEIGYVDMTGLITAGVRVFPSGHRNTVVVDLDMHEQHGGPFYVGVMHWRLHPRQAESCGNFLRPREDGLSVGFRNGTDHVVQYSFMRQRRHFTTRELTILDLVGPVLAATGPRTADAPAAGLVDDHGAAHSLRRSRWAQQRRDRRGLLRRGQHGAQAPREQLPQARCHQPDGRHREAPRERRARPRPAGARREIRLKAYTDPIPRASIQGETERTPLLAVRLRRGTTPHDTLGGHHDAHPPFGDGRLRCRRHHRARSRACALLAGARRSRSPSPTPLVPRGRPGSPGLGADRLPHGLRRPDTGARLDAAARPHGHSRPRWRSRRSGSPRWPCTAGAQWSAHQGHSSESAAVARAAHDVLAHYFPGSLVKLDADLATDHWTPSVRVRRGRGALAPARPPPVT